MENDSLSSSSDSEDEDVKWKDECNKDLSLYLCTSHPNCLSEECNMIHPFVNKTQLEKNEAGFMQENVIKSFHQFNYLWKLEVENGKDIDEHLQTFIKTMHITSNQTAITIKDEYAKLLEKEYNNPSANVVNISETPLIQVDFDKFLIHLLDQKPIISYSLIRLTTPPKLLQPININSMPWSWYWKQEGQDWKEINIDGGGAKSAFHPLEKSFLLKETTKTLSLILDCGRAVKVEVDMTLMQATILSRGISDDKKDKSIPISRRPINFLSLVEWTVENTLVGRTSDPCGSQTLPFKPRDSREWVTFGDLHQNGELRFPTSSEELEENFLKSEKQIEIQNLKIDFTKMQLIDTKNELQTEWRIRREEMCKDGLVDIHSVLVNWDPMPKRRIYVAPIVRKNTEEWDQVNEIYSKSLQAQHMSYNFKIDSIRRIQNPWIRSNYERTKASEENLNLQERYLFHGTKDCNVGLICEQNFDPKLAKHNNTLGGEVWFSKTAAYSLEFCNPSSHGNQPQASKTTKMFLCKVLVQDSSKIRRRLLGQHRPHNQVHTIPRSPYDHRFVITLPHSYYPEYLLYLH